MNLDHYLIDQSKLIYAENRVRRKVLQHLDLCLYVNLITFFSTIKDLFNHLKDIFGNFYPKDYTIEKFQKLKMGASSFSNFYSEFI